MGNAIVVQTVGWGLWRREGGRDAKEFMVQVVIGFVIRLRCHPRSNVSRAQLLELLFIKRVSELPTIIGPQVSHRGKIESSPAEERTQIYSCLFD